MATSQKVAIELYTAFDDFARQLLLAMLNHGVGTSSGSQK